MHGLGRDRSVTGGGPGDVSRGQVLEDFGHGVGGLQVAVTVFKEEEWQRQISALEGPSGSLMEGGGWWLRARVGCYTQGRMKGN